MAQNLSYRQLCLIALFANINNIKLRENNFHGVKLDESLIALLNETFDLYQKSLITCTSSALLSMIDLIPFKVIIQGQGAQLFLLMELNEISVEEIMIIAQCYSNPSPA